MAGCRAYAAAIAEGIVGGDRAAMISAALVHAGEGAGAEVIRLTIEAARKGSPSDYQSQMGWARIALQGAFHRLASGARMAEAVTATGMQGGDTDTNDAITSALLGAADGLAGIPDQWRLAVTTYRPMRTTGATLPRPATYWLADARELAKVLVGLASKA